MAIRTNPEDPIIRGNQHVMRLQGVVDEAGAAVDMSAWSIKFFLRRDAKASELLPAKTATVSGTFGVDQVAEVTILSAESEAITVGAVSYAWKRIDANLETDLAYGEIAVRRTASR